jgi:hypothetical protein
MMMTRLIAGIALLAALAAPAASAKEGAQARLLTPLPMHAAAGTLITIRWTVTVPGPNGRRMPFGADGMFATLIGADHAISSATDKQGGPPFSVRLRVPAGGIHAIRFGLHGFSSGPRGTRPAPMFFPMR